MSTQITFPPFPPSLKLPKRSSEPPPGAAAPERVRSEAELAALRAGEPVLGQDQPPQPPPEAAPTRSVTASPFPSAARESAAPFYQRPGTTVPFHNEQGLHAAWDQFHRARILFEDEQKNTRDLQHSLDAREAELKRREAALALREQAMAEREALIAAAPPAQGGRAEETDPAAPRRTRSPFVSALFGS